VNGARLAALARKYRALSALRARRDQGAPAPARAELRELAAEFPGCLRELDTLGSAELERRAAACAAAAAGGAAREPWMAWIDGYHTLMRAALQARRAAPGSAPESLDPARDPALDPAFLAAVRAPPGGRLGVAVLRRLAAEFGVPAATIAAALFPLRRPSPYQL
jgi:hypothetical protein